MDLDDETMEDDTDWEIDEVMASSCDKNGDVKYLVRWKGYPDEDDWTEEPFECFEGSGEGALRKFHRKLPQAARDKRVKMRG